MTVTFFLQFYQILLIVYLAVHLGLGFLRPTFEPQSSSDYQLFMSLASNGINPGSNMTVVAEEMLEKKAGEKKAGGLLLLVATMFS